MDSQWHKDYIQLAFRIEKPFRALTDMPYVDFYYGPQEWKQSVQKEPEREPLALLRGTTALLDTLSEQGFDTQRTTYLSKQVGAMHMACRKLNDEHVLLEESLLELFDIPLKWTPESQFEEALAFYNEALPGKGTLANRLHEWRKAHKIPWEARGKVPVIIEMMLTEIRRRTLAKFDLPENEGIALNVEQDDEFGGACWYDGKYRSRVEVNINALVQSQAHVNMLLDTLCHEVYPGHHTQHALCEQHLYRKQGYIEESIGLIFSPRATIGECFATNACGILFSPHEQETWLAEHIYPLLGITPDNADVEKIQHAADLLEGVRSNVVFMLHQGRDSEEIRAYADTYMQHPDIAFLKEPFHEGFGIVEVYAKQLLRKHLQGADRWSIFRQLITQQLFPSMLENQ